MGATIHRLTLFLEFPEGLRPGAGKSGGNQLQIDFDGKGRPVLRGTSLAGVLRHAYADACGARPDSPQVSRWFGFACDARSGQEGGLPSPLRVHDMVFGDGSNLSNIVLRHHNAMDRHWGVVRPNGLYDIQALAPGVKATAVLLLETDDPDAQEFFQVLVGLFESGLTMGGNCARGIGRAVLEKKPIYRAFDCTKISEESAFLDEIYAYRQTGQAPVSGKELEPTTLNDSKLQIHFTLAVPRGQDICVGNGQGLEHDIEPQRVARDGKTYWLLPGSSLRGVFRSWFTRLAARASKSVRDSHARALQSREPATGDAHAWGFDSPEERKRIQEKLATALDLGDVLDCPVMRLFGSCYSKGRIHIADSLSLTEPAGQEFPRMHVAVDRITGGATEGFLFSNTVLSNVRFPVFITVDHPEQEEVEWLAQTIRAIDMGILRVGSSKAGGRLALEGKPKASGPFADLIEKVVPLQGGNP